MFTAMSSFESWPLGGNGGGGGSFPHCILLFECLKMLNFGLVTTVQKHWIYSKKQESNKPDYSHLCLHGVCFQTLNVGFAARNKGGFTMHVTSPLAKPFLRNWFYLQCQCPSIYDVGSSFHRTMNVSIDETGFSHCIYTICHYKIILGQSTILTNS